MSKAKKSRWKKGPVSLIKLIPSFITLIGLCIGLSSIRFSFDEKWENAVLCILIAALFDSLDGRIARLLKASSTFGAELDSLADFLNFGLAPVLVTYLWILDDCKVKVVSWGAVMFFAICASIRLARFNSMALDINLNQSILKKYFIGVPSPIAAILALLPLINEFDLIEYTNFSFRNHGYTIAIYQTIIALLMASSIPTFAFKDLKIERKNLLLLVIGFSVLSIIIYIYTWLVVPALAFIYLLFLPISYISWKRDVISSKD